VQDGPVYNQCEKVQFVHVIKFVKVRKLFPKRKVRFGRAEQMLLTDDVTGTSPLHPADPVSDIINVCTVCAWSDSQHTYMPLISTNSIRVFHSVTRLTKYNYITRLFRTLSLLLYIAVCFRA